MEDIDVTRRLRPQKTPDDPPPLPPPAAAVVPPPRPPPFAPPPAPVFASASPPPPPPTPSASTAPTEELHTIRFAPHGPGGAPGYVPGSEPDPVTGWLVVVKGMGRGRSLPLGYGIHSIGRAEDQRVSVRFGDKRISRRSHLEISYDGKGRAFYLMPGRGSTLGYLNGQPVLQPSLLQSGDEIEMGETKVVFVPFCNESFDWQQG